VDDHIRARVEERIVFHVHHRGDEVIEGGKLPRPFVK